MGEASHILSVRACDPHALSDGKGQPGTPPRGFPPATLQCGGETRSSVEGRHTRHHFSVNLKRNV